MFSFQLISTLASAALLVSATSTHRGGNCDTSKSVLDLPTTQTTLIVPSTAPLFVTLGVGVQNYSCTSTTSAYTSIGAVASLFDISCLAETPEFATIQATASIIWKNAPPSVKAHTIGRHILTPSLLGDHYFVTSGTGLAAKWDFTSFGRFAGNTTAFVIAAKVGDLPAPTGPAANVDWLALNNVQGALASKVFRIDTVGGQPPTSCVPGSDPISVKYTAKYLFY
ncbi:hypothetical protein C8F04DRAFT_968403 [Mycena alexandri]|uniref:Malate dehydrogenase n=1 Tax=Mycena alexandri TaxID=1745969 RepID=A0AAD6SCD7_9AGAR|nr:hypothetical protein C8F04DRAFT_968403 [Mycena alexandri]